jgi:hypothetical protein
MATVAAVGKTCARPLISAALWNQNHFFARKTRSWSPKLYFVDERGNTLAFVRTWLSWTHEIRVFTDPTLSFELLSIVPVSGGNSITFEVTDPLNHQKVGAIRRIPQGRFQRRHWAVVDVAGEEVAGIAEASWLLAGMRLVTAFVPQAYTFMLADREVGKATQSIKMFSPIIEVDLTGDPEKRLDRRLVAAAMIVLMGE